MCWNPAKRTNEDVSSWGEKFVCAFLGFSSCVYTHTKKYLTQRRIRQCKFWMALHRTRKERNDKVWYLRTMISQVAKRLIYLSSAVFARNFLVVFLVVCFFSFFFFIFRIEYTLYLILFCWRYKTLLYKVCNFITKYIIWLGDYYTENRSSIWQIFLEL